MLVERLLRQRLASKHWSHNLERWPGPVVRYFLDGDEEKMLAMAGHEQEKCEAYFAASIRAYAQRRYGAYRKFLEMTAPRKSPTEVYDFYNVWAYFLARYELNAAKTQRR